MLRLLGFLDRLSGAIGGLLQSPLLLALRLYFGIWFVMAGFAKLQDIDKFIASLTAMNVPYPEVGAWLAALTETIGGAFLAIGFLSRLVSPLLAIVMIVAYATAHVESLHVLTSDPAQFVSQPPFNFLITTLLVWAFGPGFFSIDHFLLRKPEPPKETSGKA